MLTGIELMLKRMETHPEEFVGHNGGCTTEWHTAFSNVVPHLSEDERASVNTALTKAYRDFFNGEVMRIISGEARSDHRLSISSSGNLSRVLQKQEEEKILAGLGESRLGTSTGTLRYNPSWEQEPKTNPWAGAQIKAEGAIISYDRD